MKRRKNLCGIVAVLALTAAMTLGACGGAQNASSGKDAASEAAKPGVSSSAPEKPSMGPERPEAVEVAYIERPVLVAEKTSEKNSIVPSVAEYEVEDGLTNVANRDRYYFSDEVEEKLAENGFVVTKGYSKEFFDIYESNRYRQLANFVTVDSLMHTYHLYFSYLMNDTEKDYLSKELCTVTESMLKASLAQYEELIGTQWEMSALTNVEYFAVACDLLGLERNVPDEAAKAADEEFSLIMEAGGIYDSPVLKNGMDYTQFIPRGYYEGDEILEAYFRAMMWYGQANFLSTEEEQMKSAALMTLAMRDTALESWEKIYAVTSFFAGASDDLGYCELYPALEAAYGENPDLSALEKDTAGFGAFVALVSAMEPPKINSVPLFDDGKEGNSAEVAKGFRFMGQRFSIDGVIFSNLMYDKVTNNANGDARMLPDALDVPAALGSEEALDILEDQGDTEYEGYMDNMRLLREQLADEDEELWNASLYSAWLHTLRPLLLEKEDGYPSFMTEDEWEKKDLETFTGSYTELKHDTVLYSKQAMAEMGGDGFEVFDDRGYVEPEPLVYSRFSALAQSTVDGLKAYGMLSEKDEENMTLLITLADRLYELSVKELTGEQLTDDDYEFIRSYGGSLEHLWKATIEDKTENPARAISGLFPAALVTDIATDPNGQVLQVGLGNPSTVYVVFPIDGELRIASGSVYNFYEFTVPLAERMTDTEWKIEMGVMLDESGMYHTETDIEKPEWTKSYMAEK